jgi:drug/metabolite transporter, DME family
LSTRPHPLRGYLYIASAAFFWGVSAALGRAVFTGRVRLGGQSLHPIDPLILSQSRTTFSFLVLLLVLPVLRGRRGLSVPAADLVRMFVLGVLGVAVSNYFYYLAIQRTNVATAITLQYTAPVWILLYTVARGLQKPTLQRVVATAVALIGIALVVGAFGATGLRLDPSGVIMALIASFSFAFYNLAGHSILARYDRWIVLLYVILAASLFWIVVNPPWKIVAAHYGPGQWLFLFVFSITSVLVPFALYFGGLQHLEPTRAVIFSCLEPVFSIAIAAIALGERLHSLQTFGIVLVLAAILVVQSPGKVREAITLVEPME